MRTLYAAATAAALVALAACEEPPYQSQRCKDLRARVRMIETLRAQRARMDALTGVPPDFFGTNAQVDATIREWMDESPECFDPSL